ncbi:hypothetical protein Hypma_006230 [Hypsizygus marmoreus]|uniref:Uncharacterized protein n=1 Tax=Hypsizygus marmoreus TaxID=39966 RepID=A0A369JTA9_HYPMA|nr:hypothetical protein Hypma_006230 [Hypsizygus marmoreus]
MYIFQHTTQTQQQSCLLMAQPVQKSLLNTAAAAVHRLLTTRKLEHAFFGGFQMGLLGSSRGTKDIDVAVRKPFLHGFEKVKQAFVEDSEFKVFDGNRTDCVNAIHRPTGVHIYVMLENLPKTLTSIPEDPNHLPFYTPTQMFIRTIQSLGRSAKETHRQDLLFLYNNLPIDMTKRVLFSHGQIQPESSPSFFHFRFCGPLFSSISIFLTGYPLHNSVAFTLIKIVGSPAHRHVSRPKSH